MSCCPFSFYMDSLSMNAFLLGRRYERLLFLAAPITFISLLLLFVAFASENQSDRVEGRCLQEGVKFFDNHRSSLISFWDKIDQTVDGKTWNIYDYQYQLSVFIIYEFPDWTCKRIVKNHIEGHLVKLHPTEMIDNLRKEADGIVISPIQFWGIELPEKASIEISGTSIKIELMTFIQILQFAIAPIMILWLGSLYNTRYRETFLITSTNAASEIFPHAINVYPLVYYSSQWPISRKKTYIRKFFPQIDSYIYAFWRIILLTLLVAPSAASYIYSLVMLNSSDLSFSFIALSILVGIFSINIVIVELMPWHLYKVFFIQEIH